MRRSITFLCNWSRQTKIFPSDTIRARRAEQEIFQKKIFICSYSDTLLNRLNNGFRIATQFSPLSAEARSVDFATEGLLLIPSAGTPESG
jgi:hypothetical protein